MLIALLELFVSLGSDENGLKNIKKEQTRTIIMVIIICSENALGSSGAGILPPERDASAFLNPYQDFQLKKIIESEPIATKHNNQGAVTIADFLIEVSMSFNERSQKLPPIIPIVNLRNRLNASTILSL